MIDSSLVRVPPCLRAQKKSGNRCVGRSRGTLTTKIHAHVDAKGRPACLLISAGEVHDAVRAEALLDGLQDGAVVIGDTGYDADSIRAHIRGTGLCTRKRAHLPPVHVGLLAFKNTRK